MNILWNLRIINFYYYYYYYYYSFPSPPTRALHLSHYPPLLACLQFSRFSLVRYSPLKILWSSGILNNRLDHKVKKKVLVAEKNVLKRFALRTAQLGQCIIKKLLWLLILYYHLGNACNCFLLCNHPLFYHLRDIFLKSTYCQTQKTMNTCKISGMLIVYCPITIKFRIRQQTSKPPISYRCCLRFSYLAPYWLISRNTITSHKYFWCSRFCGCHSNQSTETLRKCLYIRHYSYIF